MTPMNATPPKSRAPITSHVLDVSAGKPAIGISVTLERRVSDADWKTLHRSKTNADGRVEDLLAPGAALETGVYRLSFDTGAYFRATGAKTFYPSASVVFEVDSATEHYHVPLLLSPFGYSTYRGT